MAMFPSTAVPIIYYTRTREENYRIMKITTVIVTYNRLELLRQTVGAVLGQTRRPDEVIVVNNGSTDGTAEWLAGQAELTVLTQDNVGGSGGFFAGMQAAMAGGADLLWCMDDDVFPRADCLERQLEALEATPGTGISAPARVQEGKVVGRRFTHYNLTNPLASMYGGKERFAEGGEPVPVAGVPFEGPLVRREVVERAGLPNRDLFIFCDDTDFCLRAGLAGFGIVYVPAAVMDKASFFKGASWGEREEKKKWKRYYQVRNATYLNHHYGRNWGVRYLRGLLGAAGYMLTALFTAPFSRGWRYADIPRLWRAWRDGVTERLGRIAL